jgi:cation diffusion facilitator CzcD-associated flavoprotein CzcO
VVVATGPFQVPFVPPAARRLDASVTQLHSAAYRNPQDLPDGPVLVVGDGNSGFQITEELAATRQSALLGFVSDDAAYLADCIAQQHAATAVAATTVEAGAAQQPSR